MTQVISNQIRRTAYEQLGYEQLRPGQQEAIQAVLAGHDTLAIMPTGSGKSAIYQIAALQLPGPAIVISPLIALQHDQVESIMSQEIGDAAVINSTLTQTQQQEMLEQFNRGEIKFLFLAPEQLRDETKVEQLRAATPSLLVVDEAHCISEWGHDFRPAYLKLGAIIEAFGHPTVLALTATAAPLVRQEIVERLGMRDVRILTYGFDRPNIELSVRRFESEEAKRETMLDFVVEAPKPGIVYVATRKHAEAISEVLQERRVGALYYHGGMKKDEREAAQNAFMQNEIEVIVATSAFGMGVDKPNVRFVFHYNISESLDSYYQEVGRAGRDGEPAQAILFYYPNDLNLRRFQTSSPRLEAEEVAQVTEVLEQCREPLEAERLSEATELAPGKLTATINRLEEIGTIEMSSNGELVVAETDLAIAAEEAALAQERHRQFEQSRVEMMRGYAELSDCRGRYLLDYFGEESTASCNHCDNCAKGITRHSDDQNMPFAIGSHVKHEAWGEGQVLRYEGDKMVVLFDTSGYRTLAIEVVTQNNLLVPSERGEE